MEALIYLREYIRYTRGERVPKEFVHTCPPPIHARGLLLNMIPPSSFDDQVQGFLCEISEKYYARRKFILI